MASNAENVSIWWRHHAVKWQGWGLLSRFPPFRYFPIFSTSPKYMLVIGYHAHIWQVLPQISCGDTCQIWMWFKECKRYLCKIENFAYGEIDERSFNNPHPWSVLAGVNKGLHLPPLNHGVVRNDRGAGGLLVGTSGIVLVTFLSDKENCATHLWYYNINTNISAIEQLGIFL